MTYVYYAENAKTLETGIAWTKDELLNLDFQDGEIIRLELPPLSELVMSYYNYRSLKVPAGLTDAMMFLVSEVGELADNIVSMLGGWVRNDPEKERGTMKAIEFEIGDVLMMLTMTGLTIVDPIEGMIRKFRSKGWRQE